MSKQIELYVDDEYYDLVPRPSKAQRRSLKESIKTEGLHEPIIINKEGKILDGHTRFEICQELGIKPEYRIKDFKDKEAERLFVVTVNVRRRHLNDFQLLELLEKELQMISQKAKEDWYNSEHIGSGHKKEGAKKSDMKRQDRSVYKEIGEQLGMNPIRIEKFMQIKRHATKEQITSVRSGEVSISKLIKRLEFERGHQKRKDFEERQIPDDKSPFKFCPVCGTSTLLVFVGVKEKHCTKCDFYYELKRRRH